MIRYMLAVGLFGCGLCVTASAQGKDQTALAKILADWKEQQSKVKTARYVLTGTVEYVAPLLADGPPLPAGDRRRPIRAVVLLDLEQGRVRFEKTQERAYPDGRWVSGSGTVTFDGKETRQGRTPGQPNVGGGFDLLIAKGSKSRPEGHPALDLYWPILFGHGIVPTVHTPPYIENLPRNPDPQDFVSVGRRPLGGRSCEVLRTEPRMAAGPLLDEFWIDSERGGGIRRHVSLTGGEPWTRLDVDWRQTTTGWWPEKWTHSLTIDGKRVNQLTKISIESYEHNLSVDEADFTMPVVPGMEQVIVVECVPPGRGLDPNRPARRTYRITESGEWQETDAKGFTTLDGIELPPARPWRWWYYAAAGAGTLASGVVVWVWHRRRSSVRLERTRAN